MNGEVAVTGVEKVSARWARFGPPMVASGFQAVFAVPLHWHHNPIGALNVFRTSPTGMTGEEKLLVRAFADPATVLIVHSDGITAEMAIDRARDALESRTVVEQAKGVLSHQHGLDMAIAYAHLKRMAVETGATLTATAAAVLLGAQQR